MPNLVTVEDIAEAVGREEGQVRYVLKLLGLKPVRTIGRAGIYGEDVEGKVRAKLHEMNPPPKGPSKKGTR